MSPEDAPNSRLPYWLDQIGLWDNPFAIWNAERDPHLPGYFVDVGQFDELLRLTEPCVVFAGRGCGKTAQRQMLAAHCLPAQPGSARLAISYTYAGFEHALAAAGDNVWQVRPIHHVAALLRQGVVALVEAARRESRLESILQRPDIAFRFAAQIARHAPHLATASSLMTVSPQEQLGASEQLAGFVDLVLACGLSNVIFLVDGLDEFPLTAADPAQLAAFLAPLLGTMALIEYPGAAFKFFLPQGIEPVLRNQPWFRPDRLRLLRIAWTKESLRSLITQRLAFFSKSGSRTYSQLGELCSVELADRIDRELIHLASGQPRLALALADRLLRTHCLAADPPRLIAHETWESVKADWSALAADFVLPPHPVPSQGRADKELAEPRITIPGSSALAFSVLVVDETTGRVQVGQLDLTTEIRAQDYRVLACLHRHRGAVCSKEQLVEEAWPDAAQGEGVTDQAIAAAIARLRKNLRQPAPERGYIETVKGRGYRLHPEGFVSA